MKAISIKGGNRELGREQGFIPLMVRDSITFDEGTGHQYPCIEAAFMPTAEELVRLNNGDPILLRILGVDWPPVSLEAGDDITDEEMAELKKYHIRLKAARVLRELREKTHNANTKS